jgi:hypothetical protein
MTFNTPNMSVKPAATRKSSMPMMRPLVTCVMTQAGDPKQLTSEARSTMSPVLDD